MTKSAKLVAIRERIAACRICVEQPERKPLPHDPRPVAVLSASARIAICGQAPGTRVHASGVPFTDPSGDRLREWMGVTSEEFYDSNRIAIVPMGFCFPGLDAKGGDLPPRRECARQWRGAVFSHMEQVELILAVGLYAQKWHLGALCGKTLGETVADWKRISDETRYPSIIPLPHPSWRNNAWIARHPWFSEELLPVLRVRVRRLL